MKNNPSRRLFLQKSALATTGISLLSSGIANAFSTTSPYNGYNPYVEEKTDLRSSNLFGKHVAVTGKVYDKTGINPLPNVIIEVWHVSPNSTKYRHRGKLKTDSSGKYSFITDYPNSEHAKAPRMYFKVSNKKSCVFTELVLNETGAHITATHWEKNQHLGNKLFPTTKKTLNNTHIKFNLSI